MKVVIILIQHQDDVKFIAGRSLHLIRPSPPVCCHFTVVVMLLPGV